MLNKLMNIIKSTYSYIEHNLVYVLLGIVLGALVFISYVRIDSKVVSPQHNVMIFRGELDLKSTYQMLVKIASLPYGSDLDVYIDSPGGSIACLETLFLAIKVNGIVVHAHTYGPALAASAAAIFMIKADTMDIDPATIFVFHLGSMCPTDNECHPMSVDAKDITERYMARSTAALNKVALDKCMITKEEYDQVLAGQDVFVSGTEVLSNMMSCKK